MSEFRDALSRAEAKKILDLSGEKLMLELATEFGERLGYAHVSGIPKEVAFDLCKKHFLVTGQAMIDLANIITIDVLNGCVVTK